MELSSPIFYYHQPATAREVDIIVMHMHGVARNSMERSPLALLYILVMSIPIVDLTLIVYEADKIVKRAVLVLWTNPQAKCKFMAVVSSHESPKFKHGPS